jgi:hypothetical protein
MTFSEFITLVGWEQYLRYCKQKNIQPVRDIDVKAEKPCALLDKNFTKQND